MSRCPNCGWYSPPRAYDVSACASMERDRDHFLDLLRRAMRREVDWEPTQGEFEQWCVDLAAVEFCAPRESAEGETR